MPNSMSSPPLREFPRSFLPNHITLEKLSEIEPLVKDLLARNLDTQIAFSEFFTDYSELVAALSETGSRLYIDMTCQTDNEAASKAYLSFIETIAPSWEQWLQDLHIRIHNSEFKHTLPTDIYGEWEESLARKIALFRPENIPLQTQIALLSKDYQEWMGSLAANWNGEEKTMTQLEKILESPSRLDREKAWKLITSKRLEKAGDFNRLFFEMKTAREKQAHNAGYPNYIEYVFASYDRTDYTADDCATYHEQILKYVVPLYTSILKHRKEKLGIEVLRPWDLNCSATGKDALKPFNGSDELCNKISKAWNNIDPEFAGYFNRMEKEGLLDLENRKGKAPGGYQSSLEEKRVPFIFMNAVGAHKDVMTLFHECGHSWHEFLARNLSLCEVRHAPMEFCEVASMSMERAGLGQLELFYTSEDAARALASEEEEVIRLLIWVAVVDQFQSKIYSTPKLTTDMLGQIWRDLYQKYFPAVDWSGFEKELTHAWHKQLHIFEYPFYYIEYGIAQIGALQWENAYKQNPTKALAKYKEALSLGGTKGLRNLFKAANLEFSLNPGIIEPLAQQCYEKWQKGNI